MKKVFTAKSVGFKNIEDFFTIARCGYFGGINGNVIKTLNGNFLYVAYFENRKDARHYEKYLKKLKKTGCFELDFD